MYFGPICTLFPCWVVVVAVACGSHKNWNWSLNNMEWSTRLILDGTFVISYMWFWALESNKLLMQLCESPLGCYISTQSFCVIAWVPSQYHPFLPIKDIDLIKKKEKKKILIFYSFFFFFADWYWYFIQLKKNILIFCVMCNIIWREISL